MNDDDDHENYANLYVRKRFTHRLRGPSRGSASL